ncbi:MAG: hypothetical protein RI958_2252 [Actinomycetota bacterium]|jgi:precorrin-8X/cobalt-precorrin-8 methylmutase
MFDTVVTVDWSASSRPTIGADSIWICVLDVESRQTQLHNPPTRHQAAARLCSALVDRPGSVLIAVDVALGYPQGFARLLGCTTNAPWRFTWDLVSTMLVDRPDNDNNRFDVAAALNATISPGPGPFWGTTSAASVRPSLQRTKPPGFPHCCPSGESLGEWRRTEQALRARRRHPASVWQLAGAGSVGSQTLTAIPVLSAIRDHPALRRRTVVWPFETDLVSDPRHGLPDSIVIAEAWPSAIDVDLARHPVRDAAQVLCLAEHLVELDRDDRLGGWFGPDLVDADRLAVVAEEGWVLGTEVSPLLA